MLTLPVLAADYAGTLELAAVSEVRARTTSVVSGPGNTVLAFDFYTEPQIRASVTDRHWEYTLRYLPGLTLADFFNEWSPQFFETGSAGVAWHDRAVRLAVTEDATHGIFNSAYLLSPAAASGQPQSAPIVSPALQPLAIPVTVNTLSTLTMAGIAVRIGRRTSFSADAAYNRSGALDYSTVLPEQKGPIADATFSYAFSHRDQAVTTAHALWADFAQTTCLVPGTTTGAEAPCMPQDQIVQLDEGIVHFLRPATTLTLSGGASLARTRLNPQDRYQVQLFPDAGVLLTHRSGEQGASKLLVGVQVAPALDQRLGVVTNRVQAQASSVNRLDEVVTLRVDASALRTIANPAAPAATMIGGEVEVAFRVNRRLLLAAGERGAWQSNDGSVPFFSTLTYFDVTVVAPTLRY
jgi:hypothetical protein